MNLTKKRPHTMRLVVFALSALSLHVVCHAQDAVAGNLDQTGGVTAIDRDHSMNASPRAIYQQRGEFIVPELIVGGEWTSTLKVANWGQTPIVNRSIYFVDSSGAPMTVSFQTVSCSVSSGCTTGKMVSDSAMSLWLTPGFLLEVTFFGGANTQFGHAVIDNCSQTGTCSSAGLYAEVILKNSTAARADFESVFPLEQPSSDQFMSWDHRNGLSTVLYLINPNTTASTVTLTFINQLSQAITKTLTMQSAESQLVTLPVLLPESIGLQGSLEITARDKSGAAARVVATGLRINPTNSFTPLRAYVPSL